jgi:hypothetical protein
MPDVIRLLSGERRLETVVADWYSFQNLNSINTAYRDWFGIDVWKLVRRRRKIGKRIILLEEQLNRLIEFRHGIVHHFDVDFRLGRDDLLQLLDTVSVVIETFVDHLEKERGIVIRDQHQARRRK